MSSQFDLEIAVNNLYHISLQYFTLLCKKDHPRKSDIALIMDKLIDYKKTEKERTKEENTEVYNGIHKLAYQTIENIYEYDKEEDLKNGVKIEPQKLSVGFKVGDKDENKEEV
jgi:hypothetical protein